MSSSKEAKVNFENIAMFKMLHPQGSNTDEQFNFPTKHLIKIIFLNTIKNLPQTSKISLKSESQSVALEHYNIGANRYPLFQFGLGSA